MNAIYNFFKLSFLIILLVCFQLNAQEKIDRKELVSRHNIEIKAIDTLASLSVGNGTFAYTVDVTGLQTFPEVYQHGVPWERNRNGVGIAIQIPEIINLKKH